MSTDPTPRARPTGGLLLVVVVLVVALVGACSDPSDDGRGGAGQTGGTALLEPDASSTTVAPDGQPSALIVPPPGFAVPDNRGVGLTPVTGKPRPGPEIDHTTPLLPIQGGTAKVRGTVFGPDGPVEHARVRLERWVGFDFGRLDIETDKDGRYEAADLLGGRYRVRAWVTDAALTTVSPQLTFLPAKDAEQVVDLTVERHDSLLLQGALDRAEPHVGEAAILYTLLAQEFVDEEGIVRGRGIPEAVLVARSSVGARIDGDGYGTTNADGFVFFTVTCTGLDAPTVGLESSGLATTVTLPECQPAEATTTTTSTTSTTTTTRPAVTTTTVAPTTRHGR